VIEKLKAASLLDDNALSKIYAENLARIKFNGPNVIYRKLKQKGLPDIDAKRITGDAVSAAGGEEEIAKKYLKKNILMIKRLLKDRSVEKIRSKFYSNGFSNGIIKDILKDIARKGVD
jgi:SOS response regulatory protein OraA/RecX